jgi:preprotein translocase subunit SecG
MSILIGIFTFVLILVSAFLILVVLAQKAKSDGGMGSAMGGGMAEAAFGGETGNVLTKATINAAIAFFVLSFFLYLAQVYQSKHVSHDDASRLPVINMPAASTTPASAPAPGPVTLPASAPAAQP